MPVEMTFLQTIHGEFSYNNKDLPGYTSFINTVIGDSNRLYAYVLPTKNYFTKEGQKEILINLNCQIKSEFI